MTPTYIIHQNHYYIQVVASPLAPVLAIIFLNNSEKKNMVSFYLKSTCWVWLHEKEYLENFQKRLKSIHDNMTFTEEIENTNIPPPSMSKIPSTVRWNKHRGGNVLSKLTNALQLNGYRQSQIIRATRNHNIEENKRGPGNYRQNQHNT